MIQSLGHVVRICKNWISIRSEPPVIVEEVVVGKIVQLVRTPADRGDDVRTKIHGGNKCDHIRLKRHLTLIDEVKVDVSEELK